MNSSTSHSWTKVWQGLACLTLITMIAYAPVVAQTDNVTATKHNLSFTSGGADPTAGDVLADYGEICVYCHTPHGGQIEAPLWNRAFPAGPFDMYDASHSSTIDMTVDATPTGVSNACLSCHDGTIGLDVIVNAPNSFAGAIPPTSDGVNTMPAGGNTFLDTDLRNDHPISVAYDPSLDTAFNTAASIKTAGIKLYTDNGGTTEKVQCASCHNPHNNTNEPLLRIDNAASALCLTCHIK